jgi:DNA-binding LacI/PurR family transcriptional regulator
MSDTTPQLSERRNKSSAVIARLREQIIDGRKPSDRLATFNEMESAFGVSRAVLREAVNQLKRDGFIYAVDRQGLYVAERPPHLSRFGIVFSNNPSHREWSRFSTAFQHEATGLQQERGDITFASYHDVASAEGESYGRLLRDVESQRLAGLILMPGTHAMGQEEGPFASPTLPKIYVFGDPALGRTPSIGTDDFGLCDRMMKSLHDRGRRRIAVVAMAGNSAAQLEYMAKQGVPFKAHWAQTVARDAVPDVRNLVALLMDYSAGQRPDGLIILDDNLTEHAVGGLLAADLKVGVDLDVIAHCNWPWPIASAVPIERVGYHARHVLALALRGIDLMRQGKRLGAPIAYVPALFESEVNNPFLADAFEPAEELS